MKKYFRKSFLIINLLILFYFILPLPTFAVTESIPSIGGALNQAAVTAGYDTAGTNNRETFAKFLGQVVGIILSFLGVIFIIYVIYGGFVWLTAAGNEDKVAQAKKILRNGLIGIVIVLSAASIYWLIRTVLIGGSGPGPGGPID